MTGAHRDLLVLTIAIGIFMAVCFYQIRLPGLYYDEAVDVAPAMHMLQGDTQRLDMLAAFNRGAVHIPVMVMLYVGAVSTYAVLPFYWLFGPGVESTRAMTIVVAAVGLICAYLFLRDLFDRRVAALTILLAAVHPALVLWSRMGIYVSSPMLTFAAGSLLCLLRWRQGRGAHWLYGGALLLGLGLSTKLLFLWFIIAVVVAVALLGRLPRVRVGRRVFGQDAAAPTITGRMLAGAGSAFLAGAWMIVAYNVHTPGTLRFVLRNALTTGSGVNNLDIAANMRTQMGALVEMLDGSWFRGQWGPAVANRLMPLLFGGAVILLLIALWRGSLVWRRRRVAFVLLLVSLLWLQSCFTITGLGATHLYILYPFPQALIVLAALQIAQRWRAGIVAAAIVALAFVSDAWVLADQHRAIAQSGGIGFFSDAVYDLAADLDRSGGTIVAADWGIRYSVDVLTQGRVRPSEVYGFNLQTPQDDFANRMRPFLRQSDSLIVFHAPRFTAAQGRFAVAQDLAASMGLRLTLERTYRQRDGAEVLLVYRPEPIQQ